MARRRHLDQRAIISRERPQRRPYPALFDLSIPCLTCFGSQARFRLISGSERTRRRRLPPVGDGVAQAALSSAHAGGGRPPGPLCGPGWSRARGTFGPDSAGRDHRQVVPRVTPSQHRQLTRWAECARLTYNWALSEWDRQYADHRAGSQPGRTRRSRSRSRSRRAALSRICSGYSGRRDGCRTGRRSPCTLLNDFARLVSWSRAGRREPPSAPCVLSTWGGNVPRRSATDGCPVGSLRRGAPVQGPADIVGGPVDRQKGRFD